MGVDLRPRWRRLGRILPLPASVVDGGNGRTNASRSGLQVMAGPGCLYCRRHCGGGGILEGSVKTQLPPCGALEVRLASLPATIP